MKIRKATIKDLESLKEIKILSKMEEARHGNTLKPIAKTKEDYISYLKTDLTRKTRAVFIALESKKVVGMILAQYFDPLVISKFKRKGYLNNLYVLKEHRNKNIGKKLIARAWKWLDDKKVEFVTLEVHVDNKGPIALYHNLGFQDYTIKMSKNI